MKIPSKKKNYNNNSFIFQYNYIGGKHKILPQLFTVFPENNDIFVDMFGGSFGHCTELGNTIIAENVAETILKLYN